MTQEGFFLCVSDMKTKGGYGILILSWHSQAMTGASNYIFVVQINIKLWYWYDTMNTLT